MSTPRAGDKCSIHLLRFYELEYIKRHGRWVSNVVHVYLWEGSGFNDMAKKMSEAKFVLHANL